MIKSAG